MGNPLRPIPEFIGFKYFWNPNIPSLVSQHKSTLPEAFDLTQIADHDNMPFRGCPRHAQRAGGRISRVYPVQVLRVLFVAATVMYELTIGNKSISRPAIKYVVSTLYHPTHAGSRYGRYSRVYHAGWVLRTQYTKPLSHGLLQRYRLFRRDENLMPWCSGDTIVGYYLLFAPAY